MSVAIAARCPIPERTASDSREAVKPDFFIVGAPKCGTSAMTRYLGMHPEVFMARKEMHHFGSDLSFARHFYRRDRDAYLNEFAARGNERWAGEASVWYLFSKRAAEEIHAFNPEARILILLREPVEMLYSLYYQFRFDGNEELPTFEAALAAEVGRRNGEGIPRRAYFGGGLAYRDVARYSEQVSRFLEVFGREQVKVVIYEEFAEDTADAYREVLEFLGLEPGPGAQEFAVVNANKEVKGSVLSSVLGDPMLRSAALAIRPWLPAGVFSALQGLDSRVRRSSTVVTQRSPMAAETRVRLREEFAGENERLCGLLRRELKCWRE